MNRDILPFISAFSCCNFDQRCLEEVVFSYERFLDDKLSLNQREMRLKPLVSHLSDFAKTGRHVYITSARKQQPIKTLKKFCATNQRAEDVNSFLLVY
jgi:hypothetical protein